MLTVSQLSWRLCRRCGRITRHHRNRYVRPSGRPSIRTRFRTWLIDLANPWACLEHPLPSHHVSEPPPRGGVTTIEVQPLERFLGTHQPP